MCESQNVENLGGWDYSIFSTAQIPEFYKNYVGIAKKPFQCSFFDHVLLLGSCLVRIAYIMLKMIPLLAKAKVY